MHVTPIHAFLPHIEGQSFSSSFFSFSSSLSGLGVSAGAEGGSRAAGDSMTEEGAPLRALFSLNRLMATAMMASRETSVAGISFLASAVERPLFRKSRTAFSPLNMLAAVASKEFSQRAKNPESGSTVLRRPFASAVGCRL